MSQAKLARQSLFILHGSPLTFNGATVVATAVVLDPAVHVGVWVVVVAESQAG